MGTLWELHDLNATILRETGIDAVGSDRIVLTPVLGSHPIDRDACRSQRCLHRHSAPLAKDSIARQS